ncbi:Imm53 family immunity protein [Nonomuraea sp. NPDC051191]|uniref:Imm53 family immunity protein n=1 Tax=Nonomuraea sp. NPDC051191 TaxID=3364372 RepID=UPI003794E8FB
MGWPSASTRRPTATWRACTYAGPSYGSEASGQPKDPNSVQALVVERAEDDWVHAWSSGLHFEGACGPLNLTELLEAFRDFVGNAASRPD